MEANVIKKINAFFLKKDDDEESVSKTKSNERPKSVKKDINKKMENHI